MSRGADCGDQRNRPLDHVRAPLAIASENQANAVTLPQFATVIALERS